MLDDLPRCDHPPCVFLKAGSCDPPWGVLRIGLDEGIEQHPGTLDVADLGVGFEDNAVQGSEIPFGVDGGGCAVCGGGARNLRRGQRGVQKNVEGNTWSSFRERILSRA